MVHESDIQASGLPGRFWTQQRVGSALLDFYIS